MEIREAYGQALLKYGKFEPRIAVVDADVSGCTKSALFGQSYPDRFFNVGIAEANMVSIGAGLANSGMIPFVNAFAAFLTTLGLVSARNLIGYGHINVKLAGAYTGISSGLDGATHHALEDIAVMRSIPGMQVTVPSDAFITDFIVKSAIDTAGPEYIRLTRANVPDLYAAGTKLQIGVGNQLAQGTDCTIIACGGMVHLALKAAEQLKSDGISVAVVDMFTIKPIDRDIILASAASTGAIVTAEEHSIIGGLGSAVAEVLSYAGAGVPQEFIGTKDCYTESGTHAELLQKYGMDVPALCQAVKNVIARKRA